MSTYTNVSKELLELLEAYFNTGSRTDSLAVFYYWLKENQVPSNKLNKSKEKVK